MKIETKIDAALAIKKLGGSRIDQDNAALEIENAINQNFCTEIMMQHTINNYRRHHEKAQKN